MNEKTGTGISSEKEKVKEPQSQSVTPSLDTPSGAGLGASQYVTRPANSIFNTYKLAHQFKLRSKTGFYESRIRKWRRLLCTLLWKDLLI